MMPHLAFLSNLSVQEILVVLAVILLMFGSSKIPQLMRSLGSGISEFKKGVKEGEREDKEESPPLPKKP